MSAGAKATLNFGDNAKLEIFYNSRGRYVLLTGDLFKCDNSAVIPSGKVADDFLTEIISDIERQNKPVKKISEQPTSNDFATDSNYKAVRRQAMFDFISVKKIPNDTEWTKWMTACKSLNFPYAEIDAKNREDSERYNEEENLKRYNSFDVWDADTAEGVLCNIAKEQGWSESDFYNEYQQQNFSSRAESNAEDFESRELKNCPVQNYTVPKPFLLDADGITRINVTTKTKKTTKIKICNTPVFITARIVENFADKHFFEVTFKNQAGKWQKKIFPASILFDNKKIVSLIDEGFSFTSNTAKYLTEYLCDYEQANRMNIKIVKCYNKTGWTDDSCTKFIFPHKDADYILRREGFDFEKMLAEKGNANDWRDMFKKVVANAGNIAMVIIGASVVAPLVEPFNIDNIQVHLWGKFSTGKTALLKIACSVWGNVRELCKTFSATLKNQFLSATALNGCPLIIDELETLNNSKKDAENLNKWVYGFFDGKTNQANKKDGTARVAESFKSSRLSTGEREITFENDTGGKYKRVMNILANKIFDNDFAVELHKFLNGNFGHFGKGWYRRGRSS